jgi:fermentation-respiration switch protein FrsA (DUF1100 family)
VYSLKAVRRPKAMSLAVAALVAVLAALAVLHVLIYFAQERMLFFPQPLVEGMRAAVFTAQPDAREIELATADGQRLHGWFIPNGSGAAREAPVLIYFGGNAEEVSHLALEAGQLRGISLVLFNYRGYGKSTGTPGEQALFSDALAIYDQVASLPGIDPKRIIAMGRSLGSGVATYLASQRAVAAVVLVTPYDSMAAVGRGHYPFLLVDVLLRHRFDSASRARTIDAPMLALIAGADTIVPPERGKALAKAWRGPVTSLVVPNARHNDIGIHPEYWQAIRRFLGSTVTAPVFLA